MQGNHKSMICRLPLLKAGAKVDGFLKKHSTHSRELTNCIIGDGELEK